nr:MAG TPA: hypothetical protein [Caudoviricetes sp.]
MLILQILTCIGVWVAFGIQLYIFTKQRRK